MGIAPYKTFTFDGESSADYGIYITGEGVFNAPERAVEMVEIPNRNGAFALDKGRFENVEVTYRIGLFDEAESDFADKVSAFRNWICSKVGYCRLEDEYNPDEFRMAVYKQGLKLEHDFLIAGEAEITFDCKPQRWLKSGESAVSVTSGDTLTNPTRFDASPLLEVSGLGKISLGSQNIVISNVYVGEVVVADGGSFLNGNDSPQSTTFTIDDSLLNNNDVITLDHVDVSISYSIPGISPLPTGGIEFVSGTNLYLSGQTVKGGANKLTTNVASFAYGTSSTFTATANCKMTISNVGYSYTITIAIAYDGADGITITVSDNGSANLPAGYKTRYKGNEYSQIIGDSTKSALGSTIYIDLDIGEAWNEDYGYPVSVNNAVSLGSVLPVLPSGATAITYDNTITNLKIAARWWKV